MRHVLVEDRPKTKSDFALGWQSAEQDLENNEILLHDILLNFKHDMPKSEREWGYFAYFHSKMHNDGLHDKVNNS